MSDKTSDQEPRKSSQERRPYTAPRMVSIENLEAAANACNPPAGGKSTSGGCGNPGDPFTKPLGS
ncbi:hypothetical protein EY643_02375 [Halioglobus maricola]|uniref:Uncharacterized protein n=1 Tax=Halioglobus maricola TaxID=2601894 RepID=A0A5P9NGC1_9GAMM|nr:hypothetical protein [Halioglobus maricola]QFU74589.1 hypothetical protein EY643_02375 [Halioglobus maricola]